MYVYTLKFLADQPAWVFVSTMYMYIIIFVRTVYIQYIHVRIYVTQFLSKIQIVIMFHLRQ